MTNPLTTRARPLSPNIQIYRPQLTSVLSILNRITGVILSGCSVVLVIWLMAAAEGPQPYAMVQRVIASELGQIALLACTFAFFLHLCGGIRHLVWDTTHGFELRTIYLSGWIVVAASAFSRPRRGPSACGWRGSPMNRQTTPSPLARAIGPGSAKKGLAHWWLERVTAVALLPLTIWFAASITVHTRVGYGALIGWLSAPLTTVLMIFLLITLFCHTALGLEVVIEDYVHSAAKGPIVVTMRLGCLALAVAGVLASLRIAFGG